MGQRLSAIGVTSYDCSCSNRRRPNIQLLVLGFGYVGDKEQQHQLLGTAGWRFLNTKNSR